MVQINKTTALVRGMIMQHRMFKHLPANTVNQYTSFTSLMFEDLRTEIKNIDSSYDMCYKNSYENEGCLSCQSTIGQSFAQFMIFVTWFSYFQYRTQLWNS